MRRAAAAAACAFAALALLGCASSNETTFAQATATPEAAEAAQPAQSAQPGQPATSGQVVTTRSGLQMIDHKVGTGKSAAPGYIAVVHYTGWLYQNGVKGRKFDSSVDRKQPLEFPINGGQVIKGWDEGVATMRVGGKRTLIVPPQLGYGARGSGASIPPNATLMFDVELVGIKG